MSYAPKPGGLAGPGSFGASTRSTAVNTQVVLTDGVIRVDATAGARVVTLPTPASAFANGVGAIFTIKKIDASVNSVTVGGNGGNIDGAPTVVLTTQYGAVAVQSNGTTWDVLFRG